MLPAWVAEMDFGLAPSLSKALHEAVDRGETGYAYAEMEQRTAEAASVFWRDRLGWDVDPGRVVAAPDVIEGIRRAITHLTPAGSPVVLHSPAYHPFFPMVGRADRKVIELPCRPDGDGMYRLDLDGLARALDEGAGSVVLCNPWNPTGRALTADEISAVLEVASSRSARVIADEVHAPITRHGVKHVVAATIDPETVVTVTSASKAWNVPGLKCAQVVLTREEDLDRWPEYITPETGASIFGFIANTTAYREGVEWLDGVREAIDANRVLVADFLAERLPYIVRGPLEATYLTWLDFRAYGLDDPAGFLLEKCRIALQEGLPFGVIGAGHARLNFATTPEILTEVLERMAGALEPLTPLGAGRDSSGIGR